MAGRVLVVGIDGVGWNIIKTLMSIAPPLLGPAYVICLRAPYMFSLSYQQ